MIDIFPVRVTSRIDEIRAISTFHSGCPTANLEGDCRGTEISFTFVLIYKHTRNDPFLFVTGMQLNCHLDLELLVDPRWDLVYL